MKPKVLIVMNHEIDARRHYGRLTDQVRPTGTYAEKATSGREAMSR